MAAEGCHVVPIAERVVPLTGKRRQRGLTLDGWIRRSENPRIRAAINNDIYLPVYREILSHIGGLPTKLSLTSAVICVHVAYGWMPTALDPIGVSRALGGNSGELLRVLDAVRESKRPEVQKEDLLLLKQFANNSTVGASKLLHFLNPRVYPIWDGRVAARYLWSGVSRGTFDDVERLEEYIVTLWSWSREDSVKTACAALKAECPNARSFSTIRLIELALFHPRPA
jgi:hypothetical protein